MAYSEVLDARLQILTSDWEALTRRTMFGGVGYMLHGNMVCGVMGDDVILRLGKALGEEILARPGFKPFDSRGRPMIGWVMADASIHTDESALEDLLAKAKAFTLSLPPKGK